LTTINLSELVVGSGHRPPHQMQTMRIPAERPSLRLRAARLLD
jgi:hypothetical protein